MVKPYHLLHIYKIFILTSLSSLPSCFYPTGAPTESSCLWSMEKMRAYFCLIKTLKPCITQEANTILSRYYQLQRQSDSRNAARTTIRMLESLSRLAEGQMLIIYNMQHNVWFSSLCFSIEFHLLCAKTDAHLTVSLCVSAHARLMFRETVTVEDAVVVVSVMECSMQVCLLLLSTRSYIKLLRTG